LGGGKNNRELQEKDRFFENRLIRARTEEFEIIEYYNDDKTLARIFSKENNKKYYVSARACECEDYQKNQLPCKHMMYLALHNGHWRELETQCFRSKTWDINKDYNNEDEFIPEYWKYYNGSRTGMGYTNFYIYEVIGREHRTSKKTGKETDWKKRITVYALSTDGAMAEAKRKGVEPPYSKVAYIDVSPSYEQFAYIRGINVPYPSIMDALDIGALLTRYQEKDDERCPGYLFEMANYFRIRVSYFSSPTMVISQIWYSASSEWKRRLFCYTVYCHEVGYYFGNARRSYADQIFDGYAPNKSEIKYIENYRDFAYRTLSKRSNAYKSAVHYLHSKYVL